MHSCPRCCTAPPQLFPVLQLGGLIGDLSQPRETMTRRGEEARVLQEDGGVLCRQDCWEKQKWQAGEQTTRRQQKLGAENQACVEGAWYLSQAWYCPLQWAGSQSTSAAVPSDGVTWLRPRRTRPESPVFSPPSLWASRDSPKNTHACTGPVPACHKETPEGAPSLCWQSKRSQAHSLSPRPGNKPSPLPSSD